MEAGIMCICQNTDNMQLIVFAAHGQCVFLLSVRERSNVLHVQNKQEPVVLPVVVGWHRLQTISYDGGS
eukprot:m.534866 g.534866  ORF g.534866 m.534866 type:complete len:69 (+) comp22059_c0_seq18:184-390(+)